MPRIDQHSRIIAGAVALVTLFLLAGCATPMRVTSGTMIGTYEARYRDFHGRPSAKETLVIRIDGTYQQTFVSTRGKRWKHAGRWVLDNSQGSSTMDLHDYWRGVDDDGNVLAAPLKEGIAGLPVEERAGVICITANPLMNQYYARIK